MVIFYRKLKAAPRLELGIRILQTPALPLGYAAILDTLTSIAKIIQLRQGLNQDKT